MQRVTTESWLWLGTLNEGSSRESQITHGKGTNVLKAGEIYVDWLEEQCQRQKCTESLCQWPVLRRRDYGDLIDWIQFSSRRIEMAWASWPYMCVQAAQPVQEAETSISHSPVVVPRHCRHLIHLCSLFPTFQGTSSDLCFLIFYTHSHPPLPPHFPGDLPLFGGRLPPMEFVYVPFYFVGVYVFLESLSDYRCFHTDW